MDSYDKMINKVSLGLSFDNKSSRESRTSRENSVKLERKESFPYSSAAQEDDQLCSNNNVD